MPSLHISKVAVGCGSVEALRRRQETRRQGSFVPIMTRYRPKRADELIGGSIYWIVKHRIVARQEILRFEDRSDGRIDIVCSTELVPVPPKPKRAHQGWRYLEDSDAPGAEDDGSGMSELPPRLYGKLAALALV